MVLGRSSWTPLGVLETSSSRWFPTAFYNCNGPSYSAQFLDLIAHVYVARKCMKG